MLTFPKHQGDWDTTGGLGDVCAAQGLDMSQNRNGCWACAHGGAQPAHQGHTGAVAVMGLGAASAPWTGTAWSLRAAWLLQETLENTGLLRAELGLWPEESCVSSCTSQPHFPVLFGFPE